jgi:histidinol-phosphate aminotransferase
MQRSDQLKLAVPIPNRIRRMPPYSAFAEGREGSLRLDFNENTVGCSPRVLRTIRTLSAERIAMYPEYEAATKRLAKYFGVRPSEMTLANGADGAIAQIAQTFLDPKSHVLEVAPTFPIYRFYLEIAGARTQTLRYDADFNFPVREVLAALRQQPRIFFLANPNNPTGTRLDRSVIRKFIEASPKTLIVLDEAYYEFSRETVLPWIRRYPNLVVLRTFSKAAGMAGLRLGCTFACEELMQWIRRIQDPFPVNVAALVAAEAVARDLVSIRRYVAEICKSRELLVTALKKLGVRTMPSAANFVLADFGADAPRILTELKKRGILLRDRAVDFGRVGFVRITVGTIAQTKRLIRELNRLK